MGDHHLHPWDDDDLVAQAIALHRELIEHMHDVDAPRRHAELGDILFRLAFSDPQEWITFADELATASRADNTLRVWVTTDNPRLSALPWEYLRVPDDALSDFRNVGVTLNSRFVAVHPHCLFIRDERRGRVTPEPRPLGKLRVLIVWDNPGGGSHLFPGVEAEAASVRRGVEALGPAFVEVREVPRATAAEFRQAILDYQPHVIHFCGHGLPPGPGAVPPALVCGRDGVPENLTAEDLAVTCRDAPLAVIVLNCCFAGYAQPFAQSFAWRLIEGLASPPVVVAYQTPATDSSASGLAFRLYEGLRDLPVEEAVANYRRRLAAEHPLGDGTPEWGVPVVFLPHAGGVRLFEHTVNDPYPLDFGPLLGDYGFFVGRDRLRERFRDSRDGLRQSPQGGVFLLTGQPGVGKTAFLAQVVRDRPAETIHFFYRATEGIRDPGECLRSLYRSVQSLFGWREEPRHNPVGWADLLRRAGAEALARSTVLTVVMDALDEAERGAEFDAIDLIPARVPPGVCLVAASRPGPAVDTLRARGVTPEDLIPDAEDHIEDARAACEYFLAGVCSGELGGTGARVRGLGARIAESAGGNFLVLTSFFKAHSGAAYSFDALEEAAADLTSSVRDAYESFFRRIEQGLSESALSGVCQALRALVTARGPVTQAMACRAFGMRTEQWRVGLSRVRQFLIEGGVRMGGAGETTWRLYHETFREFLVQEFEADLPEACRCWADFASGWRELAGYARRYALENLPVHLDETGRRDDLARLFLDLEFAARRCAEFGPYGYTALFREGLDGDEVTRAVERVLDQTTHLQAREPELWLQHVQNTLHQRLGESERMVSRVPCRCKWLRLTNSPPLGSAAALIRTIEHEGGVVSLAFSPDGTQLASASTHDHVKLWEVRTGRLLHTLSNLRVTSVAYSPDGKALATGSGDHTVRVWEARTGRLLHTLEGHRWAVTSVAYAPDGVVLASGSLDNAVKLWDVCTGRLLHTLEGHQWAVTSLAYTPDGSMLTSGSIDKTVRVWQTRTGRLLTTLEGHEYGVSSVACAPEEAVLASGSWDSTVKLWDVSSGRLLSTLEGHGERVLTVTFAPDGAVLASGSDDKTVKLWDTRTGRLLGTLRGHRDAVSSVACAPDGSVLVSGSADKTLKLWEALNDRLFQITEGRRRHVYSAAYSPDGTVLAGGSEGNAVELWEAPSGRLLHTLSGHKGRVTSVAYAPDGSALASGAMDKTVKLWRVRTRGLLHKLTGRRLRTLQGVREEAVYSVAWAPDGSALASGLHNGMVEIWEARTGLLLCTLNAHGGTLLTLAYAPDGGVLAIGSIDDSVKLLEVRTGCLLRTLAGHRSSVCTVTYAPDGAALASGSKDKTVNLWDARTGRMLFTLEGHTSMVTSVAYAPNGLVLASGACDGQVRLWDPNTGQCLCHRDIGSSILTLRFDSRNSRRLFVAEAGEGGVPCHWDFLIEDPR